MTPTEGAAQLTTIQTNQAENSREFRGARFYCRIGTIEYLESVRLQISSECTEIRQLACGELQNQLEQLFFCHERLRDQIGRPSQRQCETFFFF